MFVVCCVESLFSRAQDFVVQDFEIFALSDQKNAFQTNVCARTKRPSVKACVRSASRVECCFFFDSGKRISFRSRPNHAVILLVISLSDWN